MLRFASLLGAILMTYNTGNALGSNDPRDLSDNAQALDRAVNDSAPTFADRLGNTRLTLAGMSSAAGSATLAIQATQTALAYADQAGIKATQAGASADRAEAAKVSVEATIAGAATAAVASVVSSVNTAVAQAEAAADAAQLSAGVYVDTAAGIAATTSGQYFSVPSADSNEYLILYKNNAGSAVEQKRYPTKAAIDALMSTSPNLFDKAAVDIALGNAVDATTGNLVVNATYNATGYIPVTAGLNYTVSNKHALAWYNSSKVFISGSASSDTAKTKTAPAGAAYLRASVIALAWDEFQVEQGSAVTAYQPYGRTSKGEALRANSVPGSSLANGGVRPEHLSFAAVGKNMLNKALLRAGFIDQTGQFFASSTYSFSDYIRVQAGQTYYGAGPTGMRFTSYYDANKLPVAGGSSATITSFTVPAGVFYVRISITTTEADTFQLEQGSAPTLYQAFNYNVIGADGARYVIRDGWSGKKWATLGDSITAQEKWQPAVTSRGGLGLYNHGSAGTRISGSDTTAMCSDTRINAIQADSDLVTVLGGTNDWAQNVALGTETSTDVTTFNGALNVMMQKLLARFPAKRIALMTTPYGEIYDYVPRGWSNAYTNTLGLTTRDYAAAIRSACLRWGVPCIDVARDAGWNTVNITTYITDDGTLLHPNNAGAARIAEVVIGEFRRLAPIK